MVSLGGDVDTMGVIAGAITEAFYRDAPEYIVDVVYRVKLGSKHISGAYRPYPRRYSAIC